MALINQNSIIGLTSITSPSASNVLTLHTNDTTERLRVSTSGLSFSGTNASLDTSGNLTVGGNVSIGGTLTYEDVTNIDSVGVVTARSGINVTGGRVLIGTTNAGSNGTADDLVVANNGSASDQAGITIRGGTSGRSQIFFSDGTSGQDEYRGMLRYDHQENSMQFRTNATERLRITSAGRIGIATDNPGAILDVEGTLLVGTSGLSNGNATINGHLIVDRTGVSGSNSWLTVKSSGSTTFYVNGGGSVFADGSVNALGFTAGTSGTGNGNSSIFGSLTVDRNGVASSNAWFQVKNGTTPIIYANGQGNVGIGTDNPTDHLQILHTNGKGLTFKTTENHYAQITGDSNRSSGDSHLLTFEGHWNGTPVAEIALTTGSDTTNKDDGEILFRTSSANNLNTSERLRITSEGYPWIKNKKTTSFTNGNTVTILTIGDHTNAVVKFIIHASDSAYRQNEWAGEYTAFVSNANGSPGVSYYLKEHWQDVGSGNWSSPTVTVSINGSGQVQFNADNSHNDANGTVDVVILSVTSTNTTIPTIS